MLSLRLYNVAYVSPLVCILVIALNSIKCAVGIVLKQLDWLFL